tara:strand:- start:89 stop:931 length:843 start_codon:yes stop_codon:yes gene_type:complete
MIKYKVIENFINEDRCVELVNDAEAILTNNSEREILNNNRQSVFSTGIIFNELLTKSKNWKDLNERLYSREFYQESLNELNLNENEFEVTNFFFKNKLNNIEKKYKNLINKKFSYLKIGTISKLLIIRIYKELLFKVKFFFKKKINLELIYDFSISRKGYKREIHRDSDSRIIVFLLYLNSFKKNDKGGNLNLHKLKNETVDYLPAQPKLEECDLVKSFTPKAGRLVLFLNSSDAFHSVSEMLGDEKRYFLYGSYTALNKENPFLRKSANKLKTDFFLLH